MVQINSIEPVFHSAELGLTSVMLQSLDKSFRNGGHHMMLKASEFVFNYRGVAMRFEMVRLQ